MNCRWCLRGTGHPLGVSRALGQPLGVFPDAAFDEQVLTLQPGDALLVYTDGVTDAANRDGGRFGVERLREVFGACMHESARAACDRVIQDGDGLPGGTRSA